MHLLERFYSAFAQRDHATMGACYHGGAHFSDPVFPDLDAAQVQAMWRMLLERSTDLRINYTVLQEDEHKGHVCWEAFYTFSSTGRKVHNVIDSRFTFQDGLILAQKDVFPFWRWSRQALGPKGLLLGWSSLVHGRVRTTAAAALHRHMGTGRTTA